MSVSKLSKLELAFEYDLPLRTIKSRIRKRISNGTAE